ncbi:hypothetical protein ACFVJ5_00025 [Nocardia sp. NPDC127606]|uniref:hypothetical protein n=1 Tax=Nocardia sp. NPDC127606 TaxID=3345406 RepID=UPI00363C33E1
MTDLERTVANSAASGVEMLPPRPNLAVAVAAKEEVGILAGLRLGDQSCDPHEREYVRFDHMRTDRGLLAAALAEANPVAALSTAVANLLADGIDREAVFAHLVRLHLALREADCDKAEDAVMDVMDRFVGWTTVEHQV